MPRRQGSQSAALELPPCEGPKLNIFEHHKSKIQWLGRLDNEDENVTSSEGYIFRARIRGREYAIKVFKFFNPMSDEYFWGPMLGEDTPLDTAAYYTDPFYAECRAYGLLRVAKQKSVKEVAVPCHGFLFLRPQEQQALEMQDIDLGLDKIDLDYQRSTIGGLKARAIVKDIASSNSGVSSTNVRRILTKVVSMNIAGILNNDIRIDNFRDGKLVDFGQSWTEPYPILDAFAPHQVLELKLTDRAMFQQMAEEEGIETKHSNAGKKVKAFHPMRLRSEKTLIMTIFDDISDAVGATTSSALSGGQRAIWASMQNNTKRTLNWVVSGVDHGQRDDHAPDQIAPGDSEKWGLKSMGISTGCEGWMK
ncbi:hypothetical protein F53441_14135 [Fusarium austroafricanum]|uniref:Uncharacterized protein n=1 Tax=Fusarium austroafricanum TaxID=2364996 RepID=A0A8H4JGC7_9HYPO|nr:hypothetical protein F53441_14135 [Fusarium austroafricanum]